MNSIKRSELQKDIKTWINNYGGNRSAILPVLKEIMKKYHKIDGTALQEVAFSLGIHPSEVYGTSTFYSFFDKDKKIGNYTIRLCKTISCHMKGKEMVADQLMNELGIEFGETTPDGKFSLEYCNCLGMCDQGPAILIEDLLIPKVEVHQIPEIIESCRQGTIYAAYKEGVVSKIQAKGSLLDEEFTLGAALEKVLKVSPHKTLEDIIASNLRGRGGAGFPTGLKWKLAMEEEGEQKYVVCNADEGEPGTFKDRFLLHRHFSQVVEGMTIAAYVIGATKGFIYLRGEYSYLRDTLEDELLLLQQKKLLGSSILGYEDFSFDIEIRIGAGAYICGEETALIESLEGKRGEPRNKPPFPVDTGFLGNPTIVNNVETFLWAALICRKGRSYFEEHGTSKSKGSKFFSISGDCPGEGIYELPFGMTIDQVVRISEGKDIKAVQVGGAAGECIPKQDFHKRIAYEAVPTGGSIILFNSERDMLDIAENFMEFFVEESCGQCTPCREGTVKILEGVRLLKSGRCSFSYLNKLLELTETIQSASKCGLGQLSVKAFRSIIENFKEDIYGRNRRRIDE